MIAAVLRPLALAFCCGVSSGLAVGAARIFAEGYPQLGLDVLAVRVLSDAIALYLGYTLAGGVAGAIAALLLRPAAGRLSGALGRVAWAVPWLCASLPVWPCVALHDRWLLPQGRTPALATLALLALLHVALSLARFPREHRPGAGTAALSGATAVGLALLLATLGAREVLLARPAAGNGSNLLLVVMDTARADRFSTYGYPRHTTPEVDAFAADAIRFENFYSTSSWTIPSHASMFTGLFSIRHGATQTNLELAARNTTLAEILSNAGYQTWAVSGNPFVGKGSNLAQGFDTFVESWRRAHAPASSATHPGVAAFETFLAGSDRTRPFFAFVNLMEAHSPYEPPPDLAKRFTRTQISPMRASRVLRKRWTDHFIGEPYQAVDLAYLSDLYDGEIAYTSRLFGQLVAALEKDGRAPDTWVVLTSDHGEHFGENGRVRHMFTLYNTAVHVPLIVRPPGGAGGARVDDRAAQLVDLFPALLDALAVEPPPLAQHGVDILAPETRRPFVFSEYYYPAQALGLFDPSELEAHRAEIAPHRRTMRALQKDGFRLIWSSDGNHELYDLRRDPGEERNLYDADDPSPEFEALFAELQHAVSVYGGPGAGVEGEAGRGAGVRAVDAETEEALRSLGYVR